MSFENNAKKHFILTLTVAIFIAVFSLSGCGGGGGGGDDGGGGGGSYPGYSELDVSFGGVVLNHTADQTVTLKNVGTINLPLGTIVDPADPFVIMLDDCSGNTLTPSETCDIQVRFTPTSQLSYSDGFVVPITGSNDNFVGVNLDGDGFAYNVSVNQVETACPDINLLVSVTDENDEPVLALTETAFSLFADGTLADSGDITFSSSPASDLSVVLAIDTSGSIQDAGVIDDIKTAVIDFIDAMDVQNEMAIYDIDDTGGAQLQAFTVATDPAGKDSLKATINAIETQNDNTALYQTVIDICNYIDDPVNGAAAGNRRAIVLVTDGEDTVWEGATIDEGLDAAIAAANDAGIPLFTIGLGVLNNDVLSQLAEDTHGQYYDAETADLSATYYNISRLFSNQYVIVYSPAPNGGGAISLRVEVTDSGDHGEDTREVAGCP